MPRPVWYEPHPVSPERKKQLRDAGYQIIDARFAPPGREPAPVRRGPGRPRKTELPE